MLLGEYFSFLSILYGPRAAASQSSEALVRPGGCQSRAGHGSRALLGTFV